MKYLARLRAKGFWLCSICVALTAQAQKVPVIEKQLTNGMKLLMVERDGHGEAQTLATATLQVVNNGSVLALRTPDFAALCETEEPVSI